MRPTTAQENLLRISDERDNGWFKPGTQVVVKTHPKQVRTVVEVYTDIPGGRRLDRPVAGFVSWNVRDMRRAK